MHPRSASDRHEGVLKGGRPRIALRVARDVVGYQGLRQSEMLLDTARASFTTYETYVRRVRLAEKRRYKVRRRASVENQAQVL